MFGLFLEYELINLFLELLFDFLLSVFVHCHLSRWRQHAIFCFQLGNLLLLVVLLDVVKDHQAEREGIEDVEELVARKLMVGWKL